MKKIYTILSAMLCLSICAKAQRQLDIAVTLVAPVTGATISSAQPAPISFSVKNVGTQSLKITDTVVFQFSIGASPITGLSGAFAFTQPLAIDSSKTLSLGNTTLTFPATANGAQQFCVTAIILNRSADSSKDINLTNNTGCHQITFANGSATGVQTVTYTVATNEVKEVYPNPVSDVANLSLSLVANSDVTVRVVDLSGRIVLTQNEGSLSKGDHIVKLNTAALQTGMYLYQVVMGENVSSGKLFISK